MRTRPVNYLLVLGYIELLPRLYGQIILPESVHWELLDEGGSERVGQWARSLPPWVAIRRPAGTAMQPATRLHRGEADAIALAEELNASLVLMDDAAGVRFALARGLTITGTLGWSRPLSTAWWESTRHWTG